MRGWFGFPLPDEEFVGGGVSVEFQVNPPGIVPGYIGAVVGEVVGAVVVDVLPLGLAAGPDVYREAFRRRLGKGQDAGNGICRPQV